MTQAKQKTPLQKRAEYMKRLRRQQRRKGGSTTVTKVTGYTIVGQGGTQKRFGISKGKIKPLNRAAKKDPNAAKNLLKKASPQSRRQKSSARPKLAEIRQSNQPKQKASTSERPRRQQSSARDKLAQIRQRQGSKPKQKQAVQSKSRGRTR